MNIIINNEINSYDANFIGQQWYKEHCDSTTHNGRSKRAKTVRIRAKYSANRGLAFHVVS